MDNETSAELEQIRAQLDRIEGFLQHLGARPAQDADEPMTTEQAMAYLGYTEKTGFLKAVKRYGVPRIKINKRRVVFQRASLEAWRADRTIRPARGRSHR